MASDALNGSNYYSRKLKYSGLLAELVKHAGPPEQWALVIDGSLHSSVNEKDPSDLYFYYANKLGKIVETLFPERTQLSTLHLGAGALSMARYIEATRPGSPQVAVEIEEDLVEFVESVVSVPSRENLEVLIGDGREVVESNLDLFLGRFNLVIVEIFLERTTPAHVTSLEFYELLKKTLTTDGVVVVNVIDSSDFEFAASQFVTIKSAFGGAKVVIDKEDFYSGTPTNALMVGSSSNRLDLLNDFSGLEPRPAVIVQGDLAKEWEAAGAVVRDVSAKNKTTNNLWIEETKTIASVKTL